jgi:antitoxin VapB
MALSIKDPDTERLVRELAQRRKTGVTGAIKLAVDNELKRDDSERAVTVERKLAAIRAIQERSAKLPVLMTNDEVDRWMYDENGLPH